MLDFDVADLYEITLSKLNRAVSRNKKRFEAEDRFQLTKREVESLSENHPCLKKIKSGKLPFVFTELGIYLVSSAVRNKKAAMISQTIIRDVIAFDGFKFEDLYKLQK